jgi:hypothetical protein
MQAGPTWCLQLVRRQPETYWKNTVSRSVDPGGNMLKVFAFTFMSQHSDDQPKVTIEKAVKFATKIENEPFDVNTVRQCVAPSVINLSTTAAKWGFTCTVFYKAIHRIEVDR